MEIKTFDTILTELCDYFDTLISPKSITRSNTNILYLLLKAMAKGLEVINNVCVVLNNKFDPTSCTEEDLVSVGKLVGTKMRVGSVSGLQITAYNSNTTDVTLLAGTYQYAFSSEVTFYFTVEADTVIPANSSVSFTALTEEIGSFSVTAQSAILVTSEDTEISSYITFSCADNQRLLGSADESILEFRKRITTDYTRQDTISELKEKILALPYVYDCSVIFNQEEYSAVVGNYTIPPYYMLIIISTAKYTEEIAEIVASSAIYPTVKTETSHEVVYTNSAFASGSYSVYLNDFDKKDFSVNVSVSLDTRYASSSDVKNKITKALQTAFNTNTYRSEITAGDVFDIIEDLNISSVKLLSVSFTVDDSTVEYVSFAKTELPNLTSVGGI